MHHGDFSSIGFSLICSDSILGLPVSMLFFPTDLWGVQTDGCSQLLMFFSPNVFSAGSNYGLQFQKILCGLKPVGWVSQIKPLSFEQKDLPDIGRWPSFLHVCRDNTASWLQISRNCKSKIPPVGMMEKSVSSMPLNFLLFQKSTVLSGEVTDDGIFQIKLKAKVRVTRTVIRSLFIL